jgi:uncharacterized membrane protein YesL
MPATVAMFSVTRKWLLGDSNISIFKTFWGTYKKEFLKTNAYGIIFAGVTYILLVGYQILRTQIAMPYVIAGYITLGLLLVTLVAVTYFFPIYVHFDIKISEYFKWSLIIAINHPILTVLLVGGLTIINYLLLKYTPGILLFLGSSLTAYITNWAVSKVYPLYSEPQER